MFNDGVYLANFLNSNNPLKQFPEAILRLFKDTK